MKILISPFAAKLPTGNRNPKNWPYFAEMVQLLNREGSEVIQIGVKGEDRIEGVGQFIVGWPLRKLRELEWNSYVSVDNFWPHYCHQERLKGGIVVWGQSDPQVFGYPENINLIKSRSYLRPLQFAHWFDVQYNPDVFVTPDVVMDALHGRFATTAVGA